MSDILQDHGPVFLGSRLKRLGERLQAGAATVIADAGLPTQPAQMPVLAALQDGPLPVGAIVDAVGSSQPGITRAVGQLVELGLVGVTAGADQRRRLVAVTPAGEAAMARARLRVWPAIAGAVTELCDGLSGSLLDQVDGLETALARRPLADRARDHAAPRLAIRDFTDDLATAFHDINLEWIAAMFTLEQADRDMLEQPRARILDPGGAILFVEAGDLGIVGTCALQRSAPGVFELAKMGVRPAARGLDAGAFLLDATIRRAIEMGAETLYLLTNARCAAAVHLYEKHGFRHDAAIMRDYGARYARCDVAMRYAGPIA